MKRVWKVGVALLLVLLLLPTAMAAEDDKEFLFQLAVDGSDVKKVETGDVITVVFTLLRTDSEEDYPLTAMQNQIRYDSKFFELVEDSQLLADGIQTKDLGMRDQYREFYMNYLSMTGEQIWKQRTVVGSFQLKVIGTGGTTKITNENYMVPNMDGSGSYQAACQDVKVVISETCTVTYESNGGSAVEQTVGTCGETLKKPADPTMEGYVFDGWYRDYDLTEPWDFEKDQVDGNLTLYAKWSEEVPEEAAGTVSSLWLLLLIPVVGAAGWFIWKKHQKK